MDEKTEKKLELLERIGDLRDKLFYKYNDLADCQKTLDYYTKKAKECIEEAQALKTELDALIAENV